MEIQDAKQARPHCELIAELLDSRQPKTEREHAAVREIERLRHDIERHIAIASEHATECERLRAELAACREDAENWRMMRRQLGDLIDAAEAGERSVIGACATYIAVCANDVGADNAKFDMDGVTDSAGTECGDWVVTVTRKGEGG